MQSKDAYRIDLEATSGRTHHLLPHAAVFVADTGGTIRSVHVNPDYKVRLEPERILEAAKVEGTTSSSPTGDAPGGSRRPQAAGRQTPADRR